MKILKQVIPLLALAAFTACHEVVVVDKVISAASEKKAQQEAEERDKNKPKPITDGTITVNNESSNTTSEIEMKDGKKNGLARQYYADGKIWKEVNYKNGKLHGEAKVYDTEGRLQRVVTYKDGIYDGKFTKYFKSGKAKVEASYKMGMALPGIIERDYRGNTIKQPEIVFTKEDKTLKENLYNVIFELDKKAKDVKFYAGDNKDFWKPETNLALHALPKYESSKNKYYASFNIPKGYFLAHELHVYATYKSSTGEDAVTYKVVNIAAENPGY